MFLMTNKFWNFITNDAGERTLRLEGPIDSDNIWGDSITPQAFREELEAEEGDITVWINSPGGSVFAAAEIYTMLCDYKGKVTVKIDAIAASAASVVAMAGERVLMSPVAMLMIHDPMTIAMGNANDMEKAIGVLNEIKESIINAYQKKTGMSRNKISKLMSDETWLNAKKAVELGFADEILFADNSSAPVAATAPATPAEGDENEAVSLEGGDEQSAKAVQNVSIWASEWQPYSTRAMGQAILNRLIPATADDAISEEVNPETGNNETVLESGVNATAEETQEEIQTQEEEASSESEETTGDAMEQTQAPVTNQATEQTQEQAPTTDQATEQAAEPTLEQITEQTATQEISTDKVEKVDNADNADSTVPNEEQQTPDPIVPDTPDADIPHAPEITDKSVASVAVTEPDDVGEPDTTDTKNQELTIGLDGKAKDGSMPYLLLEKQLELLR